MATPSWQAAGWRAGRAAGVLLGSALLLAAAPPPIPVPPIPPEIASRVIAEPIAPMPNRDIGPPQIPSDAGVSLAPSLYGQQRFNTGLGYPRASDAPSEQEQRNKLVPGLSLTVPLP